MTTIFSALVACAFTLFAMGALLSGFAEETAGAVCMILACASSLAAMAVGQEESS